MSRLAIDTDADTIVDLSSRVQHSLTTSGSLQRIGPLDPSMVLAAIRESRCFVLFRGTDEILGCVLFKTIQDNLYPGTDLDLSVFKSPRLLLHSMMLSPEIQGKGVGLKFFTDVISHLQARGRTVLLDCWAGNTKLRDFYVRAGCEFVMVVPENNYEIAVFAYCLADRHCCG